MIWLFYSIDSASKFERNLFPYSHLFFFFFAIMRLKHRSDLAELGRQLRLVCKQMYHSTAFSKLPGCYQGVAVTLVIILLGYWSVLWSLYSVQHTNFHLNIVPLTDTPEQMTSFTKQYARVVIGLGFPKCGSTWFLAMLSRESSRRGLPPLLERSTLHDELHYWDFCFTHGSLQSAEKYLRTLYEQWLLSEQARSDVYPVKSRLQCSLAEYAQEWRRFGNHRNALWTAKNGTDSSGRRWLSEKSPSYILNPHVASILAGYSRKNAGMFKMYVLVRDPIAKLWSNFYRRCRTHWHSKDEESGEQCKQQVPVIVRRFLDAYEAGVGELDWRNNVAALLKSGSGNLADDAFRFGLARAYIDFSYRRGMTYLGGMSSMTVFAAGCYVAPIVAYEWVFAKQWPGGAGAQYFAENFRILQSEALFDLNSQEQLIYDALCWLYFDSVEQECQKHLTSPVAENGDAGGGIERKNKQVRRQKTKGVVKQKEALTPVPEELMPRLRAFYHTCNQRLYQYVALFKHLNLARRSQFHQW